ncbi:ATP-binding cassette domain-containing protein [Schaalia sp. 19OD2882]|nr:ATP-binding cassette domain-containing protein [Schaalia sp. 19OD2882]
MDVRGVRKDFRRGRSSELFTAVDTVDLRLTGGELTLIRGRSGSGKSTLALMLGGMLQPTSGTVSVEGEDLYALDDAARSRLRNERIAMLPQGNVALRSLTVLENVLLPSVIHAAEAGEAVTSRARELIEALGLSALADSFPNELSGGELRRMGLARALVMGPDVVIADEPTAGLDQANAVAALTLLRECADAGAAVCVVAHEDDALSFADLVLTMDGGVLGR